ncbi:MAG: hypothetical protein WD096_07155 [Actinomycetota bacterium]
MAWTLDPESQDRYLLPWLNKDPEPKRAARVVSFMAGLTQNPDRPFLDNGEGVYSTEIAGFGLAWLLNARERTIVLVAEPRDLSLWDWDHETP